MILTPPTLHMIFLTKTSVNLTVMSYTPINLISLDKLVAFLFVIVVAQMFVSAVLLVLVLFLVTIRLFTFAGDAKD